MAWVSILTMYNNYPDIFDDMVLPVGVDKELTINSITTEIAELDLLYSNPIILKQLISVWSNKELYNWKKLFATMNFDYNPIDNYDRTETETINNERTNNATGSQESETTNNLQIASENVHKVSGYNSASLFENEGDTGTVNNTGTVGNNITSNSNSKDTGTESRTLHSRGNIGVTTTQQMIEQERNISEFNIYDYIVRSFKRRFCLMLY